MAETSVFRHGEYVASELRRMLALQTMLSPETMEYAQLMRNTEALVGSIGMYDDIETFLSLTDQGIQKIEIIPGGKCEEEPGETPEESSEKEDRTSADPEKATASSPTPEKKYEMTDVRAALVAARRRGVNVTELLKEFGVENFSAFPAGRYGELMERLGAG